MLAMLGDATTDMSLVYRICSGHTLDRFFTSHQSYIDDVMDDLCSGMPTHGCNYHASPRDIYGHGACNGALVPGDCNKCIRKAGDDLGDM